MLRGLMMSSFLCDCLDPELEKKIEAMQKAGVDFISSLFTICRPRFCVYPFAPVLPYEANGASFTTYDFMEYDLLWWNSFWEKIKLLNIANIGLQIDLLSAVTFKHGEYMCFTRNVQRIKPSIDLALKWPSGVWAEVLDKLCGKIVPYLNEVRLCAVLGSLEGGSAQPLETWLRNRLLAYGLRRDILFITNSHTPGMIHSPHLHSVKAFRNGGAVYASSDGWSPNASDWRQCINAAKRNGSPAIELYHWCFSDGNNNASKYEDRTRPSLAYIVKKAGGAIKELVR